MTCGVSNHTQGLAYVDLVGLAKNTMWIIISVFLLCCCTGIVDEYLIRFLSAYFEPVDALNVCCILHCCLFSFSHWLLWSISGHGGSGTLLLQLLEQLSRYFLVYLFLGYGQYGNGDKKHLKHISLLVRLFLSRSFSHFNLESSFPAFDYYSRFLCNLLVE